MIERICLGILFISLVSPTSLPAQRHERKAALAEESGAIRSVSGGTTIQIAGSYDAVFDSLVTYLKQNGFAVDSASRDAGQIATAMEISGGWHQTGKRTVLSIIKDSADKTSVRVAVTLQKRYKALQVEPWSDPKVDDKESAVVADRLKTTLATTVATKN